MAILTVQVSDESIVTLPADLAQQAGLEAGDSVEVVLTEQGLTLAPARDYGRIWQVLERHLRYQAQELGLVRPDRRDDAYWQVVEPMLHDMAQLNVRLALSLGLIED